MMPIGIRRKDVKVSNNDTKQEQCRNNESTQRIQYGADSN